MLRCFECSSQFDWNFALENHTARYHKNVKAEPDEPVPSSVSSHTCSQCPYKSQYKIKAYEHCNLKASAAASRKPGSISPFAKRFPKSGCNDCCHETNSCLVALVHLTQHLSEAFRCTKCSYQTKKKQNLKKHALRHVPVESTHWFECFQCSYRSNRKDTLKTHIRLRHVAPEQTVWYDCSYPECSYKTKNKYDMKRHMLKHATPGEVKLYDCGQCPFRSKYKSALDRHYLVLHAAPDEGFRVWLSCSFCSYRNTLKRNLTKHVTSRHSEKVKWFGCPECSYRSDQKGNLRRHFSRIHELRNRNKLK